MAILYKLEFPDGKAYIGITTCTLKRRMSLHFCRARKGYVGALQNAIRKYGQENVIALILHEMDDWTELCRLESKLIEDLETFVPKGYNMTLGGEGTFGIKYSKETLERMSASKKGLNLGNKNASGYKHTPEARAKIAEAGRNRKFSEEARDKISQAHMGNTYNKGRVTSEETKRKISEAQKGKPKWSEEERRVMSEIRKGKPWGSPTT